MKIKELLKQLKAEGVVFVKHGANHDIYYSPISKKEFAIPRHGGQEVGTGLYNTIMKQAGLKK